MASGARFVPGMLIKTAIRWSRSGCRMCSGDAAGRRPKGHWDSSDNRRRFLEELAVKMDVRGADGWKKVSARHVKEEGGAGLLKRYDGSVFRLLSDCFPEKGLSEWECRATMPHGYWSVKTNRQAFLQHVARGLSVKEPEDWLQVTKAQLLQAGGAGLLAQYSSVTEMLQEVLPEIGVQPPAWNSLGRQVDVDGRVIAKPKGHWNRASCQKFLDHVATEMGINGEAGWRNVRNKDIVALGGATLLNRYGGSLLLALRDIYPDGTWSIEECRGMLPAAHWESDEHVVEFMRRAEEALGVRAAEDWYRVSQAQVRSVPGGDGLVRTVGLRRALEVAYPDVKWDADALLQKAKRAAQRLLRAHLETLFPHDRIIEDYRHQQLVADSGAFLELDVYLPERELAFEYNGDQHYHELPFFGPLEVIQRRDARKAQLCQELGIRLVSVPYWWKNDLDTLAATIHAQYPALLRSASQLAGT